MIPIKYNLRNLRVRWVTTVMTVLGTGAVVWCSCLLFGMVDGLQHSQSVSGEPLDLIVLRKGSTNEINGGFELSKAEELMNLDGIERDSGAPLAAPELLNIPVVERTDGSRANLIIRGVSPASRKLRPNFTIIHGRDLVPGRNECIISRNLTRRFQGAQLGGTLRTGDRESYHVVGIFTAGGSAAESEVWVDIKDLTQNTGREGSVSSVQLRAQSPEALAKLIEVIDKNTNYNLYPWPERKYFENQQRSRIFLEVFGIVIALFLTIGAMFAAANTMFAAVSARTREIGTMRALGFSRGDVLWSFLSESILLCALGGALGLLAALPLGAMTFNTFSADSFSELSVKFRVGPTVMATAVVMTVAMGLFGGLFPALRAVRLNVINALREL
jgi:putative ABC transport system permease protein